MHVNGKDEFEPFAAPPDDKQPIADPAPPAALPEAAPAAEVVNGRPAVGAPVPAGARPAAAPLTPARLQPMPAPVAAPVPATDGGYLNGDPTARPMPTAVFYRELIETLLLTLLIFWAVNAVTGRFRIEGQSMLPTLHEGEYVLINKLAYYFDEPQRGDIIVLHYPRDRSRDFIKRVIGLPGDTVEIGDEEVAVNGVVLNEPYISAPASTSGTWVVPDDSFFVMGDNRNNSSDSRNWSFLPRSDIIGKAWVIYWPIDAAKLVPHVIHPVPSTG